ncbi:MAG: type IV secretion system protein [Prevotellaceae bacterium]|jgi:conjugative transposon TraJ protein|nr:type IV secretion system protein [Prevotellaceae bacterium]
MDKLVEIIFKRLEWLPSSIGNIVGGMAAIGALFYVGHRVWHSMVKGEPLDPYPLLRPVAVAILIFAFPTFVITPLHYILSPTRTGTAQMVYSQRSVNKARINEVKEKCRAHRAAEKEKRIKEKASANKSGNLNIWQRIGEFFTSIRKFKADIDSWAAQLLMKLLLLILEGIRTVIGVFFKLLRIVFLVILGCIGPIALAMSLFPSYENSFGGWLSKYIGIYMWLPLIHIIEIIGQEMEVQILSSMILSSAFPPETGANFVMILMFVVIIFAYLQIPDMAGWIIQGGSVTLQAMTGAMVAVGGAIGAGAGHVAGAVWKQTKK